MTRKRNGKELSGNDGADVRTEDERSGDTVPAVPGSSDSPGAGGEVFGARDGSLGGKRFELQLVSALNAWGRSPKRADRNRSYGIHVSDLASEAGLECDRVLYFSVMGAERRGDSITAFLRDTFSIGHAIHDLAYPRLREALQEFYPDLTFVFREEHNVTLGDITLSGTRDMMVYITFPEGGTFTMLLDVKSSSMTKTKERTASARIVVEPEYIRQLTLYAGLEEQSTGKAPDQVGILYLTKEDYPHPLSYYYVPVQPIRDYFSRQRTRIERIIAANVLAFESPLPKRGSYCTECPFEAVCAKTPAGSP